MSRNSSAFIQLPDGGHAFIDGLKQDHECNSHGDTEYQTASGKMIYWHTQRQWAHLTTEARRPLLYAYYSSIDDPICVSPEMMDDCYGDGVEMACRKIIDFEFPEIIA